MKAQATMLALLFLTGPLGAAEMDKPRLRQLAKLPTFEVISGFGFSETNGLIFNGEKPDRPLVEIPCIRKELKGDASDAERYLRLGALYEKAERKKESEDAYAKAVALCRQQVKEHPDDMHRLAQLGDALFQNGDSKEAEALLRRAVKAAPNEWRVWVALGKCVDNRAFRTILGDEHFSFHFVDEKIMNPGLFTKKPKAEQIAEMRRLRQEARRCYDRAVELAPQETKPYICRIGLFFCHGTIEAGLRAVQGEPVNMMAASLTPACAADTQRIARLSPNDPKAVGVAVIVELWVGILHGPSGVGGRVVEPETTKDNFVRWGMERLEQLTKSADKSTAAAASEILAHILMTKMIADTLTLIHRQDNGKRSDALSKSPERSLPNIKEGLCQVMSGLEILASLGQIEQHLRRAVQLDPTRELAWDLLTRMLTDTGRVAEAIAAADHRIKIEDNAHNRFLLANGYAERRQFDKAIEHLRAGLSKDENDLNCRLGLIAVLLRRDDAEALKQAGEQLDAVASRIEQERSRSRTRHYLLLRGLHTALSGRADRAKELLQRVLRQDMDNTTTAKTPAARSDRADPAKELFQHIFRQDTDNTPATALAALGEPATPADESLALAYLRARNAEIERADKRPDSPVVKVCLTDGNIVDDDLYFLSAFPQLRDLRLYSYSISDAGLVHLKRLTALRRLDLNCREITDNGLIHLKPLANLRSLDLDYTKVTDAGLTHLEAFHHLETLSLPGWLSFRWDNEIKQTITDVGLAHLCKFPNLCDVSLPPALTDKRLAHLLASLPHLQKLRSVDSKITDDGMKNFERGTELRELWLSGAEISDAGLAHLKGLRHLDTLYLDKTKITDAGLAHLKGLTDLECLALDDTAVTDAGLAHLRRLTHLRQLSLCETFTRMNGEVKLLSFFPGQEAKPAKSTITDAGLEYLQTLTALEELHLTGRPLTDTGLTHLHKLKRLKYVSLDKTKVTDKGVAELRKAFPKLDISR